MMRFRCPLFPLLNDTLYFFFTSVYLMFRAFLLINIYFHNVPLASYLCGVNYAPESHCYRSDCSQLSTNQAAVRSPDTKSLSPLNPHRF